MKSSKRIVPWPNRSNFRIRIATRLSLNRYPNAVNADFNSFRSMFPELSVSNERKHCCQSVTYFHRAPKSWKLTEPRFSRSNIPELWSEIMWVDWLYIEHSRDKIRVFGVGILFCNVPIINRTVSGLNGLHVPLESATCSSSAEMYPLRSLSTLREIEIQTIVHFRIYSPECILTSGRLATESPG